MVSQSEFVLLLAVEYLAGNQLEQSVIHLMPSLDVSQIMMYGCTHSNEVVTERHA